MSHSAKPVVHIVSNVRAQARYMEPYISQLGALFAGNYEIGRIVLVCDDVGASDSVTRFASADPRVRLVQEASSDKELRTLEDKASQWAAIGNQGIEAALEEPSDFILFMEADLCVPCDLLEQLVAADLDIVAPLVFLGGVFYDTWGFRDLAGKKINSFKTYKMFNKPIELSSVGSCVLFRTEIFEKGVRFRGPYETGLLVGVCNDARKLGYRVWTHPDIAIIHPTTLWHEQIWTINEIHFHLERVNGRVKCKHVVPSPYSEAISPVLSDYLKASPDIAEKSYFYEIRKDSSTRTISLAVHESAVDLDGSFFTVSKEAAEGAIN